MNDADKPDGDSADPERNRFSARVGRVAHVGAQFSGAAAAFGAARLFGGADSDARLAKALKDALGRSKGPLMKVAQMLATIPDFLPARYAEELQTLQTSAPPMGWPFVRRRMRVELGEGWEDKFASFEREAAAAASLGQVHRARALDGRDLAVKLQYPDMSSAVEADLTQLRALLAVFRSMDGSLDLTGAAEEIGDRLREELDYERELRHILLYRHILGDRADIATPEPIEALSTKRLLTMTWLSGDGLLGFRDADPAIRSRIAALLFRAWWFPMNQLGIIHGDPHLGNYSFTAHGERLNLLDFGCVRIFPPAFVGGVVQLYRALQRDDRAGTEAAYAAWGFQRLTPDLIDALNIWARFIYGPLIDDRVRTIADGVAPGAYGRAQAMEVRRRLKALGPLPIPREFVFMDRAAIGLGAAFLHLRAELNFARMFEESIEGFSVESLAARQADALRTAGLMIQEPIVGK